MNLKLKRQKDGKGSTPPLIFHLFLKPSLLIFIFVFTHKFYGVKVILKYKAHVCVCECVSTRHLVLGTNSEIEVLTLANSGTNFFSM